MNHYWRRAGSRTIVSARGRRFRTQVAAELAFAHVRRFDGRVAVRIVVHPPDRRRRDLDNVLKALLDALAQPGGAYRDDAQIDELEALRGEVVKGGLVLVTVEGIG
ncbi:MAG: RusA family crossover junction endodeoxyribonuclease [Phycisphaera sp.]|nr:MAG: RusA family crossover junction endodeoxyribonuclease [Phycisphaera sp.]